MQTLKQKLTLSCKGRLLTLEKPLVMGIINATPDSFFAGSRQQGIAQAVQQAEKMLAEGAAILDIGGASSRPGAEEISAEEELDRLVPVIRAVAMTFPEAIISADTYRARVAAEAVAAGASIINDISAGEDDPEMISTVAALGVPYVIMHKKGTPKTMQQNPTYSDVLVEVTDYLASRVAMCREAGIADIVIDPGFGFGKTIAHNYLLMDHLSDFSLFGLPVLTGISRKGMIQKVLQTDTQGALNGTTALNVVALMKGADILRVHDAKEAMECIKIVQAVNGTIQTL